MADYEEGAEPVFDGMYLLVTTPLVIGEVDREGGSGGEAVVGVVGVAMKARYLGVLFEMLHNRSQQCNSSTAVCPDDCDNEAKCYLIDTNGYVVFSKDELEIGTFFGELDGMGEIMRSLLDRSYEEKKETADNSTRNNDDEEEEEVDVDDDVEKDGDVENEYEEQIYNDTKIYKYYGLFRRLSMIDFQGICILYEDAYSSAAFTVFKPFSFVLTFLVRMVNFISSCMFHLFFMETPFSDLPISEGSAYNYEVSEEMSSLEDELNITQLQLLGFDFNDRSQSTLLYKCLDPNILNNNESLLACVQDAKEIKDRRIIKGSRPCIQEKLFYQANVSVLPIDGEVDVCAKSYPCFEKFRASQVPGTNLIYIFTTSTCSCSQTRLSFIAPIEISSKLDLFYQLANKRSVKDASDENCFNFHPLESANKCNRCQCKHFSFWLTSVGLLAATLSNLFVSC